MNKEMSMLVVGKMEKNMVMESVMALKVLTKEGGKMTNSMVMENITLEEILTKESLKMAIEMVMEFTLSRMVKFILEIGKMTKNMVI